MAGGKVSVSLINSTAAEVRAQKTNMKKSLDAVGSSIQGILGSWTGDAADQAKQAKDNMAILFENFSKSVEGFAKFLDNAAENWSKTESANVGNESQNASQYRG